MRTRTPPELKWLLVERATLAGDLASLKTRLSLLEAEIGQVQSTLHSLDTAIRLTEARARPDAAGVIQRHHPKYGKRGALKAFIVETLQQAHTGVTSRDIAIVASMHFGLEFISAADFKHYQRNTVCPQLYRLLEEARVSTTGEVGARTVYWHWKSGLPTLSELALLAGAAPASSPCGAIDGNQDPSGHQVAHQRDGHAAG